jgi:hypothetical protein
MQMKQRQPHTHIHRLFILMDNTTAERMVINAINQIINAVTNPNDKENR